MKKKKGGITDAIGQIIIAIVFIGVFLALLSRFNWDIIELFYWIGNAIWKAILIVANFVAGNRSFQRLTS